MTQHAMAADAIIEKGFAIIRSEPDTEPRYAYTIGRTLRGRAELIISCGGRFPLARVLEKLVAHEDETGGDLRRTPAIPPTAGLVPWMVLLEAADVDAAPVDLARAFYPSMSLLQVIVPDSNGRFPGDSLYALAGQQTWPITRL